MALGCGVASKVLTCILALGLNAGFKVSLLGLCTVFLKRGLRPLYFLNRLGAGLKYFCLVFDLYFEFKSSCWGLDLYVLGLGLAVEALHRISSGLKYFCWGLDLYYQRNQTP